jgi:arylsulfatase A
MNTTHNLPAKLASGLIAITLLATAGAAETRPNIVIIVADDLGYGDVGCYGATKIPTPNIDRLAREGMRFTDAHAPSAVCQPTRAAILTGQYYWRSTPNPGYSYYFDENEPLLPALLRDAGYRTAGFGKWHLGFGLPKPADFNGPLTPGTSEAGFDYYFGIPRSHNEPPFVFFENDRVYQLDPEDPIRVFTQEQKPHRHGWGSSEGAAAAHAARPEDEIDLIFARRCAEFITGQKSDKPFFLYVPFVAPHYPVSPHADFRGRSEAGAYGDFVVQLDHCVGLVLDALAEAGAADNTLVFLTSDNGAVNVKELLKAEHRPNGDLLGQKTDAWEGGHRVPLIARWPDKIAPDSVSGSLFGLQDLWATSLAAADVKPPAGGGEDSIDQLPVLLGREKEARREMVYQGVYGLALRQGPWVYIPNRTSQGFTASDRPFGASFREMGFRSNFLDEDGEVLPEAPEVQLYDVVADPSQQRNLAAGEPELVSTLSARLREIAGPSPRNIVERPPAKP